MDFARLHLQACSHQMMFSGVVLFEYRALSFDTEKLFQLHRLLIWNIESLQAVTTPTYWRYDVNTHGPSFVKSVWLLIICVGYSTDVFAHDTSIKALRQKPECTFQNNHTQRLSVFHLFFTMRAMKRDGKHEKTVDIHKHEHDSCCLAGHVNIVCAHICPVWYLV